MYNFFSNIYKFSNSGSLVIAKGNFEKPGCGTFFLSSSSSYSNPT